MAEANKQAFTLLTEDGDENVLSSSSSTPPPVVGGWWGFAKRNAVLLSTVVGAILGVIIGVSVGQANPSTTTVKLLKLPGSLFIRVLKFLVVPLLVSSVITGVAALSGAGGGKLALRTLLLYTFTTIVAVITGLLLVTAIHPGSEDIAQDTHAPVKNNTVEGVDAAIAMISSIFPDNLAGAAVNMDMLGLITFSITFAAAATQCGEEGSRLLQFVSMINKVFMKLVHWVMYFTPIGVMSLLAGRLAESGSGFWAVVSALGIYMATVITGLLIHALITLPLLAIFTTRENPFRYMLGVSQALLTAFGTASSSATLPVSITECVKMGISETVARFVLPLGSTVNMDGTALYEAVAAVFIAQSFGYSLSVSDNIAIVFAAVLASVGAAGIPEAGLVTMILVLRSANLPIEGIALLLPVDWLLDRCRTTVNVWGDLIVAKIVQKTVADRIRNQIPIAMERLDSEIVVPE